MAEPSAAASMPKLTQALRKGGLVICAPVYCELYAVPGVTPDLVNRFLHEANIVCNFLISEETWHEAALRFARYANRRRRSGGDSPRRMLVDFVVGAHALREADCLLTLDEERYAKDFPELKLL
jgi:predicted nucleic acid-binding protein